MFPEEYKGGIKEGLGCVAFISCCLYFIMEASLCEADEGRWSWPHGAVVDRLGQFELGQGLQ